MQLSVKNDQVKQLLLLRVIFHFPLNNEVGLAFLINVHFTSNGMTAVYFYCLVKAVINSRLRLEGQDRTG